MTIPNPPLDDLSFNEIFVKARKKIPIHTQTWTDFNYSDPGITFLDVFSWLAENKIYSLNFIPGRNYLKFLKLLGFKPRPPAPMQIALKLHNRDEEGNPLLSSVKKTDFLKSETMPELRFTPDKNMDVFQIDSSKVLLVTSTNPQLYKLPKTLDPEISRWNLEPFVNAKGVCLGFKIDDLADNSKSVSFLVSIRYYLEEKNPAGVHCDESFVDNDGFVSWEYAKNDDSGRLSWRKFTENFEDGTGGLTKNGIVSFKIPSDASDKVALDDYVEKNQLDKDDKFFWVRAVLKENTLYYEPPVIIDEISFNYISATLGTEITQTFPDVLPPSQRDICEKLSVASSIVAGLPHKQIQLDYGPIFEVKSVYVIEDIRHLELDQADSSLQPWTMVDDFDGSSSIDRHFSVDYTTGIILFGDGKNGMAQPRYSRILITYTYGPQKAFLPSGHAFDLYDEKDHTLIATEFATSKLVLSEGKPAEDLEVLISRAKTELRVPHTAVTLENIEYITKNTPDLRIARASARISEENEIDVAIMPVSHAKEPMPTKMLLDAVCRHLDKHRLLTTKIRISEPKYVEVTVSATIKTSTNVSPNDIVEALNSFLTPISEDLNYLGWPMGRAVYRSEVISVIERVAGVDCVESLSLSASGKEAGLYQSKHPNIYIDKLAFVTSGNHLITVNHVEIMCQKPHEQDTKAVIYEDDKLMCSEK